MPRRFARATLPGGSWMNIGIRLHDTLQGTLAQRAHAALEAGATCTQLALQKTLGEAYAQPAACTPGLAASVRRALGPLEIAVLGCYLNLGCADEAAFAAMAARYEAHLRLSCLLGGCVVGTETGSPYAGAPEAEVHGEAALQRLIRRLRVLATTAEKLGAILGIEPVYAHILCDAQRTRRVLDAVASPNVRLILDPVNLLHPGNLGRRQAVLSEAVALLGCDTAVLHVKDYVRDGGALRAVAAGQGEMDYTPLFAALLPAKPEMHILLENTTPQNAGEALAGVRAQIKRAAPQPDLLGLPEG